MSNKKPLPSKFNNCNLTDQSGAILVFVALSLVILLGMIGLAIDLGHAYVNKSQLQNIADASALAGASALNYSASGITEALARATDSGSYLNNKFEFNQKSLAIDPGWVTFSPMLNGTYVPAATVLSPTYNPAIYTFVKVSIPASQSSSIFFGKILPSMSSSFSVNLGAEAVAGLEKITANMAVCNGILDPFALPPGPNNGLKDLTGNFGYINGVVYELRFPGSSGRGCSDYGLTSVPGNFGFADPDGCGNSATCLSNSLLDPTPGGDCVKISLAALNAIGDTVVTENAALTAFQERFDQDTNSAVYGTFPTYNSGYVTSATNGRRVIRVSFTDGPPGGSGRYNVIGFGCFFMAARPDASPPASSICLMYVGKCGESGAPVATPTLNTSSPGLTRWVLFR